MRTWPSHELINSLNHRGYRIDVIEVATVSVNAASARLPVESSAVWLDDLSTFDVTMTAASRTSLVLGVTDAELTLAGTATGISLDAPPEFTPVAVHLRLSPGADEWLVYSTNSLLNHVSQHRSRCAANRSASLSQGCFAAWWSISRKICSQMDWAHDCGHTPKLKSAGVPAGDSAILLVGRNEALSPSVYQPPFVSADGTRQQHLSHRNLLVW